MANYFDLDAALAVENGEDDDGIAMQKGINSGQIWLLQGSMGRAAMAAIEAGANLLGPKAVRDYYGNVIPGRYDVQEGTKGSYEYVAARFGDDYAEKLLEVK